MPFVPFLLWFPPERFVRDAVLFGDCERRLWVCSFTPFATWSVEPFVYMTTSFFQRFQLLALPLGSTLHDPFLFRPRSGAVSNSNPIRTNLPYSPNLFPSDRFPVLCCLRRTVPAPFTPSLPPFYQNPRKVFFRPNSSAISRLFHVFFHPCTFVLYLS